MQRNLIESTGSNIGRYTSALLSTLYMGAGQIANGQWLKGIFLILFETFVLIPSVPLLLKNLKGLITLGETPMVDHSLFMMIYGILAAVAAIFLIVCYLVNIRDAYEHGLAIDKGGKRKGWKETLSDMIDAGFPYLILAPGILCIILFTFLPMAFNIMIAFTDYDLFHSPPRHILNWVGFRNFVEFLTTASWANTFKQVMLWTVV